MRYNSRDMVKSSPSSRRAAREVALRVLYMMEVGKTPREEAQESTILANELDADSAAFARTLIEGTLTHRDAADASIIHNSTHYPLARQTIVDRNILRIATTEILFGISGAPYGVIANEAVELAKKYSTPEAAKFVNGVIGGVIRDVSPTEDSAEIAEQQEDNSIA